jgi:hypothetical protein
MVQDHRHSHHYVGREWTFGALRKLTGADFVEYMRFASRFHIGHAAILWGSCNRAIASGTSSDAAAIFLIDVMRLAMASATLMILVPCCSLFIAALNC